MITKVRFVAVLLLTLALTYGLATQSHLVPSATALTGGSGFWAGVACGASVGLAVFGGLTGVALVAGIAVAVGTCGDAFS